MARIAGVDLPRTKRIEIGLTYIYGIGRKRSNDILAAASVSGDTRVKDLTEEEVRQISRVIEEQGKVVGVGDVGQFVHEVGGAVVIQVADLEGFPVRDLSGDFADKVTGPDIGVVLE